MNKMISYLFWISVPILFFAGLIPHSIEDSEFRFPFGDEYIEYDIFLIWLFIAIYFSIIGFVFKKIKIENNYLIFFSLFNILSAFLFFYSMIDHEMVYEAIDAGHLSLDTFATRTKIFYVASSLWLVAQTIFWFKILIHFFNQKETEFELLDDPKFLK